MLGDRVPGGSLGSLHKAGLQTGRGVGVGVGFGGGGGVRPISGALNSPLSYTPARNTEHQVHPLHQGETVACYLLAYSFHSLAFCRPAGVGLAQTHWAGLTL